MPAPRVTIDQLPEDTAVTGTELLVVQDGTTTKKVAVSVVTGSSLSALNAHIDNPTDAHDASAVSAMPTGPIDGATVQAQLGQLATAIDDGDAAVTALLNDHLVDDTAAHDATAISITPDTLLTGTTVKDQLAMADNLLITNASQIQAAINEIDNHMLNSADAHDASAISITTVPGLAATDVQGALAELKALIDAL